MVPRKPSESKPARPRVPSVSATPQGRPSYYKAHTLDSAPSRTKDTRQRRDGSPSQPSSIKREKSADSIVTGRSSKLLSPAHGKTSRKQSATSTGSSSEKLTRTLSHALSPNPRTSTKGSKSEHVARIPSRTSTSTSRSAVKQSSKLLAILLGWNSIYNEKLGAQMYHLCFMLLTVAFHCRLHNALPIFNGLQI